MHRQVCKAGLGVLPLKPLCKEITRFQGGASSFPPGLMSDPVRIVVLSIMGGALHGCSFNVSRQGQGCAL